VQKIKEFREQKGYTQSDLADQTGLSLRTIQRIESGETIPKGHTLQVLAEIVGINPSEFINDDSEVTAEHIERLKLINLSALTVILIPFGNIGFPLMIWKRAKGDRIINQASKYIINFQITWSLVLSFLLVVSPFVQKFFQLPFSLIIVILVLAYCFNVGMIFKFSRLISKGDLEHLKVTYQLL